MKKYICENCGTDLIEEGVCITSTGLAQYDSGAKAFIVVWNDLVTDIECPKCNAFADVPSEGE